MKTNQSWLAVRLERIIKTSHSMQHTGACAVAVGLLLAASLARAGMPEVDGGMPGPYPIGHTSFVCKGDEDPGRQIAVDVYYPADAAQITAQSAEAQYVARPYESNSLIMTSSQWEALGYDPAYESPAPANGPFPLVMFAPGMQCSGWAYLYFGTRLASHGYVVAVVEAYRDQLFVLQGGHFDWFGVRMYYRPRDISSALTEVLRRNDLPGDLLQNLVDRRFVVAAGHSFGGYAALTLAAGDDQVCDSNAVPYFGHKNPPTSICQPTPPDPRFTAIISLDGAQDYLRWEELSRIRVPSLIMGQANWADVGDYEFAPYVARPHAAICTQARALRVDIALADHMSFYNASDGMIILNDSGFFSEGKLEGWFEAFYNSCLPGSYGFQVLPIREVHSMITKYVVAWLAAEVVKDGSALSQRILTQAYAKANEPNIEVFWNEDCKAGETVEPGTFTYLRDMAPGACAVGDKNTASWFVPVH
jgi:dienelactone hydrolase